ncbi:hypothetical protein HanRHA438_Chr02g0082401 [Helianthus annuus]|nr:hypothetical protein HanRHA438_Chr02g0082401 [Helianthus annuus]
MQKIKKEKKRYCVCRRIIKEVKHLGEFILEEAGTEVRLSAGERELSGEMTENGIQMVIDLLRDEFGRKTKI